MDVQSDPGEVRRSGNESVMTSLHMYMARGAGVGLGTGTLFV